MRRVVVTGLGLVTPLGADVETSWKNILASKSGAGRITRFDPADHACQIACEVKMDGSPMALDLSKRVDHKVQRQVDLFIQFGIDAAGRHYYGTPAARLSREQAARLAAVVPNPHDRRPDRMGSYAQTVQTRMRQLGH